MAPADIETLLHFRWLVARGIPLERGQAETFWRLACELLVEFPELREPRSMVVAAWQALRESRLAGPASQNAADAVPS